MGRKGKNPSARDAPRGVTRGKLFFQGAIRQLGRYHTRPGSSTAEVAAAFVHRGADGQTQDHFAVQVPFTFTKNTLLVLVAL